MLGEIIGKNNDKPVPTFILTGAPFFSALCEWTAHIQIPWHKSPSKASAPLLLGALGVVFGDTGTSSIYAFGLAFDADGPFHLPVPRVVELGVQEEI